MKFIRSSTTLLWDSILHSQYSKIVSFGQLFVMVQSLRRRMRLYLYACLTAGQPDRAKSAFFCLANEAPTSYPKMRKDIWMACHECNRMAERYEHKSWISCLSWIPRSGRGRDSDAISCVKSEVLHSWSTRIRGWRRISDVKSFYVLFLRLDSIEDFLHLLQTFFVMDWDCNSIFLYLFQYGNFLF